MYLKHYQPDLSLLQSHYGSTLGQEGGHVGSSHCALLWDGYEFPVKHHNRTLSGSMYEAVTVPFFGYNGYYKLEESNGLKGKGQPDGTKVNIWCGDIYRTFTHLMQETGARWVFKEVPSEVSEMVQLVFSPRLGPLLLPAGLSNYPTMMPFLRLGGYTYDLPYGHVIMQRMYERANFLFLASFSSECWCAIWITLLALAWITYCVTSLVIPSRIRPKGRLARQRRQLTLQCVVSRFVALLLAQGQEVKILHKGLVGLWLVTVTILVGCMLGSMRNLMSQADRVIVAEGWRDAFFGQPFQQHTIMTLSMLPGWQHAAAATSGDDFIKSQAHRLELIMFNNFIQMAVDFKDIMTQVWTVLSGSLSRLILFMYKTLFYIFVWFARVCHTFVIEWMVNFKLVPDRQTGVDFLARQIQGMYDNFYIGSQPAGIVHIYQLHFATTDPALVTWWDAHLLPLQDHGFGQLVGERGNARMEEQFAKSRRQPLVGSFHAIRSVDYTGPCIVYGCLVGCSSFVLLCEYLMHQIDARRRSQRKIHPK